MRICMIAEGSYPYITGGVSGWIHTLIGMMPEHEFILFTIGAQEKQRGKFRYELPPNVVGIKETFLDTYLREEGTWGRRFRLSDVQKNALRSLLGGNGEQDWTSLFDLLRTDKFRYAADFLMSKDYFDILVDLCRERYDQIPFNEMFWTVRSMVLPLFLAIRHEIPRADLYHSVSTGYAGIIGGLAHELYGAPFVLTEHGIYSREREEEIIKADWVKGYFKDLWIEYFYKLSTCAYERADRVITLFDRNREIEIELGCSEDKIGIIPNGVEVNDYAGLPVTLPATDKFRIGAIVRVVPIKDIKTMILCFANVKREIPDTELYIMGPTTEDEEYYSECMQLVQTLQIEDVFFTGEVKIKDYLASMQLMLLSSISEGQPLAVLEGMACGLPFVTTDVGSCRELLQGRDDGIGPAGVVVPVMHYEQMAEEVVRLIRQPSLRKEMGANGLARVKQQYTRTGFIEAYRDLYNRYEGGSVWQASALS